MNINTYEYSSTDRPFALECESVRSGWAVRTVNSAVSPFVGEEMGTTLSGHDVIFTFVHEDIRDSVASKLAQRIATHDQLEMMDDEQLNAYFGGIWANLAGWAMLQDAIDRDQAAVRRFCGEGC